MSRSARSFVVGLVVALVALGGCGVRLPQGEDGRSELERRAADEGAIELDLRRYPTREQIGLVPGDNTASFQREGRETIRFTVRLPDGVDFTFEGTWGVADAEGVSRPNAPDGQPKEVRLQGDVPSLDAARRELERAATILNPSGTGSLNPEWIARWQRETQEDLDGSTSAYLALGARYFKARPLGYIAAYAGARYQEPGRVTVYYYFPLVPPEYPMDTVLRPSATDL